MRSVVKTYGAALTLEETRDALVREGYKRITTERVRQIEEMALSKMRRRLKPLAILFFITNEFAGYYPTREVRNQSARPAFEDYLLRAISSTRADLVRERRWRKEERRKAIYRAARRKRRFP